MRNESIIKLFNIVRENKNVSYPGMKYHEQLKQKEWKYYRLYIAVVNNWACELCGEKFYKGFNIHHKKYINGRMAWNYNKNEVMFLCGLHHYKVHRPEIMEKKHGFKTIKEIYNEWMDKIA
jgi:hypothetical protein